MRGCSHFRLFLLFMVVLGCLTILGCSSLKTLPSGIDLIQRVPYQTTRVNTHRIAYLDVGQGPPLILIHGFGGSMWQWEHQYSVLAQTHRVIILDLLGSGLSDKPDDAYTPKYLVEFFRQFMDALNISRATLVGNSMGAGLAMAMALDYPERVDRLVLISGFPAHVENSIASPHYQRFLHHRPPIWLAKLGNWMAGRRTTEYILKEIIYNAALISPAIIDRSFHNRQRGDFLVPLYSLMDNIKTWEGQYGNRFQQISHPVLLLWGDQDRVFPLDVGERVKDQLPHVEWHVIPEAGHLAQWEAPTMVNQFILSFLERDF
ncbi:MAG TPA: alpha/beta fold hydrolase [Nitrospirales bacterium]|nr:alpha/beta fold hydrolase [Nitrospirales bacterium]